MTIVNKSSMNKHQQIRIMELLYDLPNLRTAVAKTDVVVLKVEYEPFRVLLNRIQEELSRQFLKKFRSSKIFDFFALKEKYKLYLISQAKYVKINDYVTKQGKKSDGFYIVSNGLFNEQ
jgi:CRP-like cAMP-binding protein